MNRAPAAVRSAPYRHRATGRERAARRAGVSADHTLAPDHSDAATNAGYAAIGARRLSTAR